MATASHAIVFRHREGPRRPAWAMLLFIAPLVAWAAERAQAASDDVFTGSQSVRVTDDSMIIEKFDRARFPDFARESLQRYFKTGSKVNVTTRASGQSALQDIELVGPSKCLAPGLSRVGWQKLRFEFSYRIDDAHLERTAQVRYEFAIRFVSGEVADFQPDHEPPAERFKQVPSAELTDLANKLGGFMRTEMSSSCFNKSILKFCADPPVESCQ